MQGRPGFIAQRVYERERAHRRWIWVSIGFLLLFSTSPIFGHHLAESVTHSLVGQDHLLSLCLVALHQLLAPVHDVFHVLVVIGGIYAVLDRLRAIRRLHQTLHLLQYSTPPAGSVIERACRLVAVDPAVVRIVHGPSNPAFTAGLWRPRIFVGEGAMIGLSEPEVAAVIAHEEAHRRRRDPLRLSIWRFLSCMLFFLPALRRLADDMADEAEIAADDQAVSSAFVQPLTLASALIAIARKPASGLAGPDVSIAFHREELLNRRVLRLAGEDARVGTHMTGLSVCGAVIALVSVWLSGLIVIHPLPADTAPAAHGSHAVSAQHCVHENSFPLRHLFCLGSLTTTRGTGHEPGAAADCPHTVAAQAAQT